MQKPSKRRHPKISFDWRIGNVCTLLRGDCVKLLRALPPNCVDLVLTSPPYCMGKNYENKTDAADFTADHEAILPEIIRVVRPGGSICWQVGYHVSDGVVTPLDFIIFEIMSRYPHIHLRNRIVWTFGHGLHAEKRFSGRHELLLWFTKGRRYRFNLDAVRVAQKYPGKKHYKGANKGKYSGNPLGKNPSDIWQGDDVWDIPNVKANHVEKTNHPCQFPIGLARRTIKALTRPDDLILDPFLGSGTTAVAALLTGRRFVGAEISTKFHKLAVQRAVAAADGTIRFRSENNPVYVPPANTPLTTKPPNWYGKEKEN